MTIKNGSQISSGTSKNSTGQGSNVDIKTNILSLDNNAKISTATLGKGNAGSILVQNANSVTVNNNSIISSAIQTGAVASQPSNIEIQTKSLSLNENSQIIASTSGTGDAGQVNISHAEIITLNNNSSISTSTNDGGNGQGGNIDIQTNLFSVNNGSQILAKTVGNGDAGNISLTVPIEVNISDANSGLFSLTESSLGKGGKIQVNTNTFNITKEAILNAGTTADSLGGNIIIKANDFNASSGGKLITTTSGKGRTGDISLNTTKSILLSGNSSGVFANTQSGSNGDGGNVFANSVQLSITDGAGVGVDSQGTGNGGNIQIQVGSITLDRKAFISATTASSEGGNINLQVQNTSLGIPMLLMGNNSFITATAGNNGNGGNINIDAPFIVAFSTENSDITANAFQGRGGNIQIRVQINEYFFSFPTRIIILLC
ncbi:MAG: hypothetical protein ACKO11_15330 [Cuspidothrix sp.]